MKKHTRLNIIMGASAADVAEHAQNLLKRIDEAEHRNPRGVKPRAVPAHLAQFPVYCDDCGETFWANEQWATHQRCGKKRGGEARFGF